MKTHKTIDLIYFLQNHFFVQKNGPINVNEVTKMERSFSLLSYSIHMRLNVNGSFDVHQTLQCFFRFLYKKWTC